MLRLLHVACVGSLAFLVCTVPALSQTPVAGVRVPVANAGTTSIGSSSSGGDAVSSVEIDLGIFGDSDDLFDSDTIGGTVINRSISNGPPAGAHALGRGVAKSNPELMLSVDGLNFHDQRFANNGNQFSVEPPDQGLCAGNGFVLESVNDVLRVYDTNGAALTGVVDLNTFYGYAPAINRAVNPLTFGPEVTDPSCYYDPDTQRFFQAALTLDRAAPTTQALSGANHLDIAVSTTSDPRGTWMVFRLPVQNDGTEGTPNHHCNGGACLGDYPHIGADANGFYITTNEFPLFKSGFRGAQVYAISKHALVNGTADSAVLFDTTDPSLALDGAPGFTVWPAESPAAIYDTDNGGTEFFVSSQAVFTGLDNRLRQWTMTNTSSLNSGSPALTLTTRVVGVTPYGIPPNATQKAGSIPLRDCLADTTLQVTATLTGCWRLLTSGGPFTNVESKLPSNDSRMQQVFYANGKLWASLDTGLSFSNNGPIFAGIAYFVFNPNSGTVLQQGYVGIDGDNVTYPALVVTPSGRGVLAFTVTGADYFPSAGYTSLDAKVGAGDVHIAAAGLGPQDGFTGYVPLSQNSLTRIRPRWGDYGGAAVDGNTIWIASEYIGQTCDYATYIMSPFGQCGGTRGSLGNWGTRISKLSVGP